MPDTPLVGRGLNWVTGRGIPLSYWEGRGKALDLGMAFLRTLLIASLGLVACRSTQYRHGAHQSEVQNSWGASNFGPMSSTGPD